MLSRAISARSVPGQGREGCCGFSLPCQHACPAAAGSRRGGGVRSPTASPEHSRSLGHPAAPAAFSLCPWHCQAPAHPAPRTHPTPWASCLEGTLHRRHPAPRRPCTERPLCCGHAARGPPCTVGTLQHVHPVPRTEAMPRHPGAEHPPGISADARVGRQDRGGGGGGV